MKFKFAINRQMLFSLYIYTNKPLRILNMAMQLDEYCEKLLDEYRKLPPVQYQIGYPGNYKEQDKNTDLKQRIAKYQPAIINVGHCLNIKYVGWISSIHVERDIVLKILAPWGGDEENTWAYITSGGTEGNIAGIQFALKQLHKPILIYSTEVHYSIQKAIEQKQSQFSSILQIPTLRNGEIDYKQIPQAIRYVIGQETLQIDIPPILVVATLGTTMKGACDDVTNILSSLYSIGLTRDKIFVHLDAAFHGGFWHLDEHNPNYQMGVDFNSIAISGYKWHGADICGLFAIYQHKGSTYDNEGFREYVHVNDIAITSTRNGMNAISWMIRYLQFDWQQEYDVCQKNVKKILSEFKLFDIETFVNPASLTVCIPTLPEDITAKYCLARYSDVHLGHMCHIIVCPHVTEEVVDQFFDDLKGSSGLDSTMRQFTAHDS